MHDDGFEGRWLDEPLAGVVLGQERHARRSRKPLLPHGEAKGSAECGQLAMDGRRRLAFGETRRRVARDAVFCDVNGPLARERRAQGGDIVLDRSERAATIQLVVPQKALEQLSEDQALFGGPDEPAAADLLEAALEETLGVDFARAPARLSELPAPMPVFDPPGRTPLICPPKASHARPPLRVLR